MELVLHTESPIGYGSLFADEDRENFILVVKQTGFLPRLLQTEDVDEVRDLLASKRIMDASKFDRRFDAETSPVSLGDEEEDQWGFEESAEEEEENEEDEE